MPTVNSFDNFLPEVKASKAIPRISKIQVSDSQLYVVCVTTEVGRNQQMDFRIFFLTIFKSYPFDLDQSFGTEKLKSMLMWTGPVVSLEQYTQGELFTVWNRIHNPFADLSLPGPRLV